MPQKWQRNSVLSMWLEGTTQNPSPTPAVTGKYGAVLVERIILAGQIRGQMSVRLQRVDRNDFLDNAD